MRLWPRMLLPLYFAAWLIAAFVPIGPSDADNVFWPSAEMVMRGHPFQVYQPAGQMAYPNANGPLSLYPLAAVGMVVQQVGWMHDLHLRRGVAFLAFSLVLLLMAREGVAAIERLRGQPLRPPVRTAAYATLAVGPPIWQSIAGYGHFEQPIEIWLLLLAARWTQGRRPASAGAALGLAVLARTPAALMLVPLVLAAASSRRGALTIRLRAAVLMACSAIAVAVAGMLPFLVFDRENVLHSLVTYRGALRVGAGSIWSISVGGPLEGFAQHSDLLVVAAATIAFNLWLATRPGGLSGHRLYAGMALAAASFVLLAKTVWPYYLTEVYVLAAVWSLGRGAAAGWRAWVVPALVAGAGVLAEAGATPDLTHQVTELEGASMFLFLGAIATWVLVRAAAPAPTQATSGAGFGHH
jgi:hypothetical protein